jgi:hypothetical protein
MFLLQAKAAAAEGNGSKSSSVEAAIAELKRMKQRLQVRRCCCMTDHYGQAGFRWPGHSVEMVVPYFFWGGRPGKSILQVKAKQHAR